MDYFGFALEAGFWPKSFAFGIWQVDSLGQTRPCRIARDCSNLLFSPLSGKTACDCGCCTLTRRQICGENGSAVNPYHSYLGTVSAACVRRLQCEKEMSYWGTDTLFHISWRWVTSVIFFLFFFSAGSMLHSCSLLTWQVFVVAEVSGQNVTSLTRFGGVHTMSGCGASLGTLASLGEGNTRSQQSLLRSVCCVGVIGGALRCRAERAASLKKHVVIPCHWELVALAVHLTPLWLVSQH